MLSTAIVIVLAAAWLGGAIGPTIRVLSAGPVGVAFAFAALLCSGVGLLLLIGSVLNIARFALEQEIQQGLLVLLLPVYVLYYCAAHWPDNELTTYLLLASLAPTSLGLTVCAITFS